MKIRQFAIVLSMASALALAISGLAMAAAPNYTFTTNQIAVGNAELVCPQFGDLLGDAFNKVGGLLGEKHRDINFTGERVEDSCPLD